MGSTLDLIRAEARREREEEEQKKKQSGETSASTKSRSDTVKRLQKAAETWRTSPAKTETARETAENYSAASTKIPSVETGFTTNRSPVGETFQTLSSQIQVARNATQEDEEESFWERLKSAAAEATRDFFQDEDKEDEASGWEVAKNAAFSGLNKFNVGLASTLDLIAPTDFLGEYDPFSRLNDYYKGLSAHYDQELTESLEGKSKAAQTAANVGASTVAAIPNAVLALMTGGASMGAQGTAALTGAAASAGSTGLAATVGTAAKELAKNPLYWSSVAQTLGPDYDEAKENGASDLEAAASAVISSAINAGVEIGGGLETLPGLFKQGGNSAVRQWVRSMLEEGQEEVVQGVVSGITEKAVYDRDKEWYSTTDEDAVFNPGRMAEEGLMGAAVGGILGGGQMGAISAVNAGINRVNNNRLGKVGADYQVAAEDLVNEGLTFAPETEAYQTAQEVKARMDAGETVSDADLGRVVVANERTMQAEERLAQANMPATTRNATETQEFQPVSDFSQETDAQPVQREVPVREAQRAEESIPYNVMATDNQDRQRVLAAQQARESYLDQLGYGEKGTETFRSIVEDSGADPGQVRMEFQSAYEAGLTNLPRERASLDTAIQEEAYNAGRQDYILSMKQQPKQAAVYNNESGFIRSDAAADLDQQTVETFQAMGKSLGAKIMMEEQVYGGRANGSYSDGIIRIAKDAANPYVVVAKHEVTHRMQDLAPKEYRQYRDFAVQLLAEERGRTGTTLVEAYQDRAADAGVHLSTEGAMDEIAADFTERILTDEKALHDFVTSTSKDAGKRSMGQKFFQAVREFINKVKRVFKGDKAKMDQAARSEFGATIQQLEKAEQLWKEAYKAAKSNAANANANAGNAIVDGYMQYSLVTDKETLAFLNGQKGVKVYRAMQEIDGKLYPPMAALMKGESGKNQLVEATKKGAWYQADERPELIKTDKNGRHKFELNKGNGGMVPAAYNPYFHTSASPLNDQFSSAYNRPNIVVVEGYIPESELTSGYKARYAKDSVGETSWHAGPVASKLKGAKARRVFLSRWFKAERVVPDKEVAKIIAKTLEGEDVRVPWNVVTPSLRKALEAEGVEIDYKSVKMGSKVVPFDSTQYSLKDSEGNTLTKEQLEYFKGSKAVDEDGNLLVLYHGTRKGGFTTFRDWAYLTASEGYAKRYADNNTGETVYEVYANITKPFDTRLKECRDLWRKEFFGNYSRTELQDTGLPDWTDGYDLAEWIEENEYDFDGILLDEGADFDHNGNLKERGISYVVRSSEQIKNVDNKQPTGDKDIRFSLKDEDGIQTVRNKRGDVIAETREDGATQFSLKTYREDGRDYLHTWLGKKVKSKAITQAEADDITRQLDEFYDICQKFTDKYGTFGSWSEAEVVMGKNGRPAFSVVKANGEYAMNLDFSLVCKKRRTLDAVFREMINRNVMDEVELGEEQIAKINAIIRESGFETACALCFVDSKRYRQALVADNFVSQYNNMVELLIPEGSGIEAHRFDFLERGIKGKGRALHTVPDKELGKGILKLKKVMQENGKLTVAHKIAKHLLNHPQDRKLVMRSEFMNTDGFEAVTVKNRAVLGLYNSSKGSGGPKAALSDVQYLGDILKKSNFTPARAYAVGGVRIQSFSDYIPRLVFDYLQMIADLSAKKLPAHAYTKEEMFALQFGMTGIKVNMSLVPAVDPKGIAPGLDANGNYTWYDGQSFGSDVNVKGSAQTGFQRAIEIQNAEGYSANCGTIAVGISDEHIWKMLDDDDIRMVIPYHKSSLNHIVAVLNNIDKYTDYTSVQNTRSKATGKKIDGKDFNFNDALRKLGDAKAAADAYLEWCEDHGYLPKFDTFAEHENYYKLLEDFATYDNGVNAPQSAVTMTFPKAGDAFGSMSELIERGLEEDAVLEGRRQADVPKIVDRIEAVYREGSMQSGTQFSLKAHNDLLEENAKLRKVHAALAEQFAVTKFEMPDKKAIDTFAKNLLKDWKSGADINETREALTELYTFVRETVNGDDPDLNALERRAYEVAVPILQNVVEIDDTEFQEYKALRQHIAKTGITFDKSMEHDLAGYESLNDFRKAYFGRIRLVNGGTEVSKFYQELESMYPGTFDQDKYSDPAAQLLHIAEVLDELKPTEVNPYSHNMRETATWLATDIIQRIYDLPQAKPTFGDKMKGKIPKSITGGLDEMGTLLSQQEESLERAGTEARRARLELDEAKRTGNTLITTNRALKRQLEEMKAENARIIEAQRETVKAATAKERDKREAAVKKVKEHYKAKESKASESKKRQILRAKVLHHVQQMDKKLRNGTDKNNVPQALQGAVAELLSCINLESNYSYDRFAGGYKKNDEGLPTRRTQQFRAIKEQYEAIKLNNTIGMVFDPSLLGVSEEGIQSVLDKVINLENVRMVDMNLDQLRTVYDALRLMEHSILTAGKTFTRGRWASVDEMADHFKADTDTRRTKKVRGKSNRMLDIETPLTFFSHFGEAGQEFYHMLRNAQDEEQQMQDQLADRMAEVASLEDRQKAEKQTVKITTQRGVELTLNKAHVMEIYLLNNRPQAKRHLLGGGIIQPEVGKVAKGTEAVLLTEYDVAKIIGTMTEQERAIADGLQKLTLMLAEWGNKASMTVFGIQKFNDPNYWTIRSSNLVLNETVERNKDLPRAIENMGSAKAVNPEANNTLDINGAFDTFDRHAADMMSYSAWLAPMQDANRLFNYEYRDANWNKTGKSVKGIVERVGGKGSEAYWKRLMVDIQNGLSVAPDTESEGAVMKTIGNLKKASVSANIRVIIQQPTAYMRAMVVLGPDVMLAALGKDVAVKPMLDGWNKAKKYAPIAARKAAGGYEVAANPKQLAELLYKPKSKMGKSARFAKDLPLAGAGLMDAATWGTIWNACEMQTARKNKGLKKGSDAFYDAVKELFTEVIDQTQVVDGVLQRSQAMRSGSNFMKQMTAFTGEPTQGANMIIRAYNQLRYETDPKKRGKAIKTFSRAVTVFMLNAVLNAFAQSVWDAVLDDDDEDKDYWDKVWTSFSGINGNEETWKDFARNIILAGNLSNNVNPMSWVPVWKDVLSVIQGYSVERMDAASIGDFFDSIINVVKTLEGDGKYTTGYAALKALTVGHKLLGGSSGNFLREIEAIVRRFQVGTDDYMARYETMKLMTKPKNNKKAYLNLLYQAYMNDYDAYEAMYEDMVDGDYFATKDKTTKEYIESQIENRIIGSQLDAAGMDSTGDYYDKMFQELLEGNMDEYMDMLGTLNATGVVDVSTVESAMRSRANDAEMDPADYNNLLAAAGLKLKFEVEDMDEDRYSIDDLTMSQYTDFVGERGDLVDDIMDEFDRRGFGSLDKETANALLSAAYSFAAETALERASDGGYESDTKWISLAQEAPDELGITAAEYIMLKEEYSAGALAAEGVYEAYDATGMDVALYLEAKDGLGDIKADKNAAGKTITGSRKKKVQDYLNSLGLTYEEYLYLLGTEYATTRKSAEYRAIFGG